MKKGFTLVEIMIVIAIFGVLMVYGANLFVEIIHNSNRATVRNEVRQNANQVMQEITSEIKKADTAAFTAGTSSTPASLVLTYPGGSQVTYTVSNTGIITKVVGTQTTTLSSNTVSFIDCPTTCGNCTTPGIYVDPVTISNLTPAQIILVVQQNPTKFSSPDFCARYAATDSATPRKY